jgi:Ca-activated chloride channel family protein
VDELARGDRLAVWKYDDRVEKVSDFSQNHEALDTFSLKLGTPELSETNLYDAIIFTLGQMRPVSGRKAIVLISSGIDTLSKAGYDDLLRTAENSDTPIYVVSLAPVLSPFVEMEHATKCGM